MASYGADLSAGPVTFEKFGFGTLPIAPTGWRSAFGFTL